MNRRGNRGFSLLEVLVAFTVLALALGTLLPLLANVTNSARVSESYAHALMIAESRMAVLSAALAANGSASYRGMSGSSDGFSWAESVRDYATDNRATGVAGMLPRQLEVRVSWSDGSRTREVGLTSIRLSAYERN
jgi:general secretion pathway protein I